jgi:hypothetical protein
MAITRQVLLFQAILISCALQAQILYTDIADTVLTFPVPTPQSDDLVNLYYFDLDRDSQNDVVFIANYFEFWASPSNPQIPVWYMRIGVLADSSGIGEPELSSCQYPELFFKDDRIGAGMEWMGEANLYVWDPQGGGVYSCCAYAEDDCLGFKIFKDGVPHYGWIRISAHDETSSVYYLKVMDFALNLNPGEDIKAGQKVPYTGITEDKTNEPWIIVTNKILTIEFKDESFKKIQLVDLQGRVLLSRESFLRCSEFSLEGLSQGIYIINVLGSHCFFSKKIIL